MLSIFRIPPVRFPFNDFVSIENPQQGFAVAVASGILLVCLAVLIHSFWKNYK